MACGAEIVRNDSQVTSLHKMYNPKQNTQDLLISILDTLSMSKFGSNFWHSVTPCRITLPVPSINLSYQPQ